MQPAYIIDTVRIPRARLDKQGGLYAGLKPVELLKPLFHALTERNQFESSLVEDVLLGCSTQTGEQGANLAKIASLFAGWSDQVSGATINRFCCSGLDAINLAASKVMAGLEDLLVAGGVEQLSRVPMFSDKGSWFSDPEVMKVTQFIHMGVSADIIASLYGYSREALEQLAVQSHQRAKQAIELGRFNPSLVSITDNIGKAILEQDNGIRPNTSNSNLATLNTHFDAFIQANVKTIRKTYPKLTVEPRHTVGTSPAMVDGASLCLIASANACQQYGFKPRARLTHFTNASDEPVRMLTGHIRATEKLLESRKLKPGQIDLWEVNESFAASVLHFQTHFEINSERMNANGSAIALGHPLGATGGNLMCSLLDEMERQDLKRGVIAICGGAGVGVSTLIERE